MADLELAHQEWGAIIVKPSFQFSGTDVERIDAPAELADMAFRAVRLMGLTLAGVDALPTADGYLILEVNPVPGMLDMLGEEARQETLAGVYDWVEKQAAAG